MSNDTLTMQKILWAKELALREHETNMGFTVINPDDWTAMRVQLEQRGLTIYETDKPHTFYVDGERIDNYWLELDGTEHLTTHYTGRPVHLMPTVEKGKMMLYDPPTKRTVPL